MNIHEDIDELIDNFTSAVFSRMEPTHSVSVSASRELRDRLTETVQGFLDDYEPRTGVTD